MIDAEIRVELGAREDGKSELERKSPMLGANSRRRIRLTRQINLIITKLETVSCGFLQDSIDGVLSNERERASKSAT